MAELGRNLIRTRHFTLQRAQTIFFLANATSSIRPVNAILMAKFCNHFSIVWAMNEQASLPRSAENKFRLLPF